jgi:NAD(P)-dependent dehydrogenase (short-subunit alcohol dehydrogenase family)
MSGVAVVLSAETGIGTALCRGLRERGWTVVGGNAAASSAGIHAVPMNPRSTDSLREAAETIARTAGKVDLLICNSIVPMSEVPSDRMDFEAIRRTYDTNALGAIRFVEAFLPLTENGLKRLCFVTDAGGSIERSREYSGDIGVSMAATALHMTCKNLFNDLRRDGYTFRLYLPNSADADRSGESAIACFTASREHEDRLVIVDSHGEERRF